MYTSKNCFNKHERAHIDERLSKCKTCHAPFLQKRKIITYQATENSEEKNYKWKEFGQMYYYAIKCDHDSTLARKNLKEFNENDNASTLSNDLFSAKISIDSYRQEKN